MLDYALRNEEVRDQFYEYLIEKIKEAPHN